VSTSTADTPIMLRADITRDELAALKIVAIREEMTVQALVALLIRRRLAETA
jgi:hypothetical protein